MARRTTIHGFLIGLQAATALLGLVLIGWLGTHVYHDMRIARWIGYANELSGVLIDTGAAVARERGYTASLLGNLQTVNPEQARPRLSQLHADTDRKEAMAIRVAQRMTRDFDLPVLAAELHAHATHVAAFHAARAQVSSSLQTRTADITLQQWLTVANALADSLAHVRLDAFNPLDDLGELYRDNLQFKDLIAEAGEFAGRERGMIATLIRAGRPANETELALLTSYRAVIEEKLRNIIWLAEHKQGTAAAELSKALATFNDVYLGHYTRLRERILQSMVSGAPYPVSVDAWLQEATRGIDSIQALVTASNQSTQVMSAAVRNDSIRDIGVLAAAAGTLFAGLVYASLVIRRRITVPLSELGKAAHAISVGDLDNPIARYRDAELLDLAESFDHMRQSLKDLEINKECQMQALAQANVRMALYNDAMERIVSAGNQLARDGDSETFYKHILRDAMDLTSARYGACGLFGADGTLSRFITLGISDEERARIQSALPTGKGLLRAFYHEGRIERVTRIAADPRAGGFPPGHPPMQSLLGFPLKVNDVIKGVIYLTDRNGGEQFTEQDEVIVGMLATEIVHVLERSELLGALHEHNVALHAEHERQQGLITQLRDAQHQLLQSDKMASVGQLAAGVAHEINNPVGYINSNISSLDNYMKDLFAVLDAYEQIEPLLGDYPDALSTIHALKQQVDLGFLRQDLRQLVDESLEGVKRVKQIVQDLKDFSHVDEMEWQWVDLHRGLDSTLNVARNEIKYKAEVVKEYSDIPQVECLASQINQVFMNLLVNAAHAIEERGTITVRTGREGDQVWIEVQDTGKGIPAENLKRIYDPFFTTKPVGKGTGLGLSLTYGIIQKHNGRIEVDSEVGKGTRFRVWLPIQRALAAAETASTSVNEVT